MRRIAPFLFVIALAGCGGDDNDSLFDVIDREEPDLTAAQRAATYDAIVELCDGPASDIVQMLEVGRVVDDPTVERYLRAQCPDRIDELARG